MLCKCMYVCVHVCVCVCITHELQGVVMTGSVGSVFLGGGCVLCIYQQLLIHQHLFNCTEWVQLCYVTGVCASSYAGASLNTQPFHKTDPSRAVGGPNIDLQMNL